MENKMSENERDMFTHEQYRSAGVAHLMNLGQECEFYLRGKPISREKADDMVKMHIERKRKVKKVRAKECSLSEQIENSDKERGDNEAV